MLPRSPHQFSVRLTTLEFDFNLPNAKDYNEKNTDAKVTCNSGLSHAGHR